MSTNRQPKWDWSSHLPKMIELYNMQISIPDIHKAIQCNGFEPCQRSVYLKFRSMGYPTDPVGRMKLLDAPIPSSFPTEGDNPFRAWTAPQRPSVYTSQYGGAPLSSPLEPSFTPSATPWASGHVVDGSSSGQRPGFIDTMNVLPFQGECGTPNYPCGEEKKTHAESLHALSLSPMPSTVLSSWSSPHNSGSGLIGTEDMYQSDNCSMELNGASYFGIDPNCDFRGNVNEALQEHKPLDNAGMACQWSSPMNDSEYRPVSANTSMMDLDNSSSFQPSPMDIFDVPNGIAVKLPFQKLINTTGGTSTRNRIRSLFRPKSSILARNRKRYAVSQFTDSTGDSGYASGHASSLTLDEIRRIHSQSLNEFNGLYRVACQTLHEPQGKAQCKDIQTCGYCQYSSIHNLGWSARYLKLEVFLSELRLTGVYDFGACDEAGNTALHYAAAGGASFRHLKALIDSGVDPYLSNSAGELFIYCLRPLEPYTLEPNSDCLKSDDLVNLLGLLQLDRLSNYRDNDGLTIMHTLALKITQADVKQRIFGLLKNSGFSTTVLDRFGRTPEDVVPLTYDCHGQVIDSLRFNNLPRIVEGMAEAENIEEPMTCEALIAAEFRHGKVKQIKAHTIVTEARHEPTYMDAETGDNVFHALSRIASGSEILSNAGYLKYKDAGNFHREGNYILLNLEYFISKGVDLNLHNRNGSHPLRSFICDRPWDESETGATMSKYLDTLLWSDQKKCMKSRLSVNMKDREGFTALHHAAMRGRPDSVRSLIEAGANVNARTANDLSVLCAAFNALDEAERQHDGVLVHLLKEVVSHLEHAGAVQDPTSLQERGMNRP